MGTEESKADSLRIAVVGGAGYIGSVVVPHLLRRGHRVRVLDRFFFGKDVLRETAAFGDACELLQRDTRDITAQDFQNIDVTLDLAGLSNDPSCALDEELTHSINVDGGVAVLQASKAAGVRRYIYQSSCSVYGAGGTRQLTEASPLSPVSAYARSKVAMEGHAKEAAATNFEVVLPRLATVFGASPRMRFDLMINSMTARGFREGRIFVLGGGRQWRPLIHVTDVAQAVANFAEAPADKIAPMVFNVGDTEHNYQTDHAARIVARVVPNVEIIRVPDDVDKRSYRVDFTRYQSTFAPNPHVTPQQGAEEIYRDLMDDAYDDNDIRCKTVDYYRYLVDAKRVLDEVILNGRLL